PRRNPTGSVTSATVGPTKSGHFFQSFQRRKGSDRGELRSSNKDCRTSVVPARDEFFFSIGSQVGGNDAEMQEISRMIHVIGAGLAGSECALQLANLGYSVVLHEMRPERQTEAHRTDRCAELVCSNSFGSLSPLSAPGQLKWEARRLGSF